MVTNSERSPMANGHQWRTVTNGEQSPMANSHQWRTVTNGEQSPTVNSHQQQTVTHGEWLPTVNAHLRRIFLNAKSLLTAIGSLQILRRQPAMLTLLTFLNITVSNGGSLDHNDMLTLLTFFVSSLDAK
jgi:hypothetical protein